MNNVVAIVLLAVGAAVTWFSVRNVVRGLNSRNWPTVLGTVLASDVVISPNSDSDGSTSTTFGAKITYQYEVEGQQFFGDRRTFAEYRSSSSARAHRIAHQYPPGSQVAVYYHPWRPELCVLEPGIRWHGFLVAGIGLSLVVLGLLGILGIVGSS